MNGATTAAYLARRAAQKERVRILYRRALKDTLNWAVHRHLFYQDASDLREKFEANKHVEDLDTIDKMIAAGEATYDKWRHPDPYIEVGEEKCYHTTTMSIHFALLSGFLGLLVVPSLLETPSHPLGLRLCMIMVEKRMIKHPSFHIPSNKGLEDP
ncbi:hypothetical protein V6N13_102861 [Hibiscus sabdariffa]